MTEEDRRWHDGWLDKCRAGLTIEKLDGLLGKGFQEKEVYDGLIWQRKIHLSGGCLDELTLYQSIFHSDLPADWSCHLDISFCDIPSSTTHHYGSSCEAIEQLRKITKVMAKEITKSLTCLL